MRGKSNHGQRGDKTFGFRFTIPNCFTTELKKLTPERRTRLLLKMCRIIAEKRQAMKEEVRIISAA